LKLSKKEVARRELATAIRLFVADGDPVSIHVLASAASAIIRPIGKAGQQKTWREEFRDRVIPEYQDSVESLLDEPFNFMKHGARDPESTLAFHPDANPVLLLMVCYDYEIVFKERFIELAIFIAMMASLHPEFFHKKSDAFDKLVLSASTLAGTPVVDLESAAKALAEYDRTARYCAEWGIALPT
jgi:hypothetical protein